MERERENYYKLMRLSYTVVWNASAGMNIFLALAIIDNLINDHSAWYMVSFKLYLMYVAIIMCYS